MGPYLAAEAAVVAPTVGLFILYRLGKGGGRPKWKLGYCLATLLAVLAALGLIVIGLVLLLVGLSLLSLGSSSSSVLAGLLRSLTTPLYMQLGERATDDLGCVVAITDALRAAAGPALMLGHLHLLAAIVAIGAVHAACAASRRLPPSRVGIITAAGRPANRHHVAASAVRADPFPMSPARVVVEAVELNAVPIAMGTAVGGPLPIGTVISAEAPTVVGATTLPMATRVSGADPGSHRDSHDAPPPVAYPCGSVVAPPSYSSAAPPPSYGATSEPGGSSDLSVQWTDFSAEFRESSRSSGGHGA